MGPVHYIVWKDEHSVGHKELDAHHRQMFTTINELYESIRTHASSTLISALFRKALDYGLMHFQAEEAVMNKVQYSGLTAQTIAHQSYTRRLENLLQGSVLKPDQLSHDVLQFLKDWWLNHILKMDRAYVPYINGKS